MDVDVRKARELQAMLRKSISLPLAVGAWGALLWALPPGFELLPCGMRARQRLVRPGVTHLLLRRSISPPAGLALALSTLPASRAMVGSVVYTRTWEGRAGRGACGGRDGGLISEQELV